MRALASAVLLFACGDDAALDPDGGARTDGGGRERDAARSDGGSFDAGDGMLGLAAFPGAEGFGTDTPGGRGGRIYAVTTLEWEGPGSFSEALSATEPRIIVFRVSGVIDVPADLSLSEENSYVTVAGQTSPGGITLRGGGAITSYHSNFHDGVFRHLRFRGNVSYDNFALNESHHIVIDHCDFSGGEDETLDITFSHDVTVQWSTYTNSGPGGQRYGFLLAYAPTSNITLHHNFSAHHTNRCAPHMHWGDDGPPAGGARFDYRNNVIYDCTFGKIFDATSPASGVILMNMVGNYAKAGPGTPLGDARFTNLGASFQLFADDNVYEPMLPIFHPKYHEATMVAAAHEFPYVTTESATEARDLVLARAGAWPRDAMNRRTMAEAESGTGSIGVVDDELIETGPAPPADRDGDAMPDGWETDHDLDPASAADGPMDADGDGYTNVEEYLDELARSLVP
jgi:pectate lyase